MEDDGEAMGEDAEILSPSDDEDEEDSSHDIGASTSVGRRGGMLLTSGSFRMTSGANRAGNDEDE